MTIDDGLSVQSLKVILRNLRKGVERAATRVGRMLGYELRRQHFYLPFPEVENLPDLWAGPRPMPGVDLRVGQAIDLLNEMSGLIAEFRPPVTAGLSQGYYLANGNYESVDAEMLYGLLRHLRPARVVELGSGASSHVIDLARRANERSGSPLRHTIYDPFPFGNPMGAVPATVHSVRSEDLDTAVVEELESGDVLFIDTTHTVRTGGDVVRIFLDLLPRLSSGVYVHVHDIFLPYEYPREWVVDRRLAWAEQYLLQAFLAFNNEFEVVFPAHAVARQDPEALSAAIPSFGSNVAPGAFWMRRV